jgi:hypothetical protein
MSSTKYDFYPIPTNIQNFKLQDLMKIFLFSSKEDFVQFSKSPNIFYSFILNLISYIKSVDVLIYNAKKLGDIISILINDLALEDSPNSKTISGETKAAIPVQHGKNLKQKQNQSLKDDPHH